VIYFHGNAATRAASNRVRTARHLTDLGANFVIIDYRGFADSTRSPPPSEEGLLVDARRVWDYVNRERGVPAERIAIMGQSLGTGVSAGLAGRLAKEGESLFAGGGGGFLLRDARPGKALADPLCWTDRYDAASGDSCGTLLVHSSPIGDVQARYALAASVTRSLSGRSSQTRSSRQKADSSVYGSDCAGSIIPLLSPLRIVPGLLESVLRLLRTRFDTRGVIEVSRPSLFRLLPTRSPGQ
jgi:pimeloyl-ACP methyl ester carboxylesterase